MPRRLDFEATYKASAAKPFDQKNEMFKRSRREPELKETLSRMVGELPLDGKNGATRELAALRNAAWTLETGYARGIATNNFGLYSWSEAARGICALSDGDKFDDSDPARNARMVKKAAKTFGADLVGICKLDRRWIESLQEIAFPSGPFGRWCERLDLDRLQITDSEAVSSLGVAF